MDMIKGQIRIVVTNLIYWIQASKPTKQRQKNKAKKTARTYK